MVKNWIVLGDEAFEGSDSTYGKVELTKEQQNNWKDIVMEQFNDAIQKSSKIREMIENKKVIRFDFYFFEKPVVPENDVIAFVKFMEKRFSDKKISYSLSYNRELSWVFIDFWDVDIIIN